MDIEKRRNLYLIFKEALNNAIKYSRCKSMQVGLEVVENDLVLRIADDGIGFVPDLVERGNGLDNMLKRAMQIDAQLDLNAAPGKGTEVLVRLRF
ncbi:MAG: hypothetical protein IPL65_19320 [Lewinellaceae bacterium]|nr:hypothetical protein [Lewinellaceae bacterium]